MIKLSAVQLRKAASLKDKIASLEKQLNQLLGGGNETPSKAKPARRKISAAGLARIRAAQKARWAKVKAKK
jgi:hypothetical protein